MAAYTFDYRPDYEAQLSQEPKVNVAKFGDGYEARSAQGINNAPEKWTLKFTTGIGTYPPALAFVQARGAVQPFYWTNAFGVTNTYVCRTWNVQRNPGHVTVSMDFEQVFEA
jgi:phage-related protein